MNFFYRIYITLTLLLTLPIIALAAPLTVSYFERPPYYFTNKAGAPDGFLVKRTQQILQTAGLDAQFISLEPNKIIYIIKHAKRPNCSIGWFKKTERELFAKFTKPLYQNRPLVLLTTKLDQHKFKPDMSLTDIFANKKLVMGRICSFSYGEYVDHLMKQRSPASYFLSSSQADLLKAIYTGSATYMLVAPEEVIQVITTASLPAEAFVQIVIDEIPRGNYRYLMCNQAVSAAVIQQFNSALAELFPEGN